MSLDSSYRSPKIVFDPDPPAVESEQKPGQRLGIIALLCGAECVLAALLWLMTLLFISWGMEPPGDGHPWTWIVISMILISPLCVIAGIVFGILGRNTKGKIYAYTGLVLSMLYSLLVFVCIMYVTLMTCC